MEISLRCLVSNIVLPDMVYLKKKNKFFEAEELDLYKLHLHKDYVYLPYVNEEDIYDSFLEEYHLNKEQKVLHDSNDFGVSFRKFINYNKKFDHELFRYYCSFESNYLKPIAIEWCKKNQVSYINDI